MATPKMITGAKSYWNLSIAVLMDECKMHGQRMDRQKTQKYKSIVT